MLSVDNPAVSVPANVTVPMGANSATFVATAVAVVSDTTVTLTARTSDGINTRTPLFLSADILLTSLHCTPTTLAVGANASCFIGIQPNHHDSVHVTLTRDNNSLTVPGSVTAPVGQLGVAFQVLSGISPSARTVLITGTAEAVQLRVL